MNNYPKIREIGSLAKLAGRSMLEGAMQTILFMGDIRVQTNPYTMQISHEELEVIANKEYDGFLAEAKALGLED